MITKWWHARPEAAIKTIHGLKMVVMWTKVSITLLHLKPLDEKLSNSFHLIRDKNNTEIFFKVLEKQAQLKFVH